MFWTMGADDKYPAVTLCERHALEATNIGATFFNLGPYEDMNTAAVELEAVVAVFGNEHVTPFNFVSSEIGVCEECRASLEAFGSEGGAA
jgi:hypothetical protein